MSAFTALLWSTGYYVLEAATGKEAIDAGNSHGGIDLLVADVEVPEPSGTAVALKLSRSHRIMSILFVSGTPMDAWSSNDLDNFSQLPHDRVDFIEKPFWPMDFLDRISELLERF